MILSCVNHFAQRATQNIFGGWKESKREIGDKWNFGVYRESILGFMHNSTCPIRQLAGKYKW